MKSFSNGTPIFLFRNFCILSKKFTRNIYIYIYIYIYICMYVYVYVYILNQGCCGSSQYNLPDSMETTLNQSYVFFIILVNITYQSGDQYLPSIHSWDSGSGLVLYIPFFLILFFYSRLLF